MCHKLEKILFIPDCHIPYEDKAAFDLMLKAGKMFRPDHVIIIGDFADFYGVSSHSKDPNRALKLKDEMDLVKKRLDQVIALGAKNNQFVAGNHEDRLERYLMDRAPELFNFISIPKIMELKKKGFQYTPYKQAYKIGKLSVTHDVGNAGRNAHQKALDTFQNNIVTGHTHRIAYMVEGNANGDRHVSTSFGWLGAVEEINYMHQVKARKEWSLGFGIGFLDTVTGVVYVVPVPIVKNTCLLDGKVIKG
jgi:predicted phosphodiesterase